MRGGHPVGNLHCDVHQFAQRYGSAIEQLAQRFAFHQFGNDVRVFDIQVDVEDGRDVRMIQSAGCVGLMGESAPRIGVANRRAAQNLERHVAAQPCIARTIHFTHAPVAQFGDDLIGAKYRADFE
jgi:hypothetical protein